MLRERATRDRQLPDRRTAPGSAGRFTIGLDVAWVQWLPGGRQLRADAGNCSYIVDVATLSARPLFFVHSRDPKIQDSQDVNYSAVVIAQPS